MISVLFLLNLCLPIIFFFHHLKVKSSFHIRRSPCFFFFFQRFKLATIAPLGLPHTIKYNWTDLPVQVCLSSIPDTVWPALCRPSVMIAYINCYRFPFQETRQTRTDINLPPPERNEINTVSPTKLREEREKSKNLAGPPVYYPPGHEAFSETMHVRPFLCFVCDLRPSVSDMRPISLLCVWCEAIMFSSH